MKRWLFIIMSLLLSSGLLPSRVNAQKRKAPAPEMLVTKFQIVKDKETGSAGALFVTVGGKERKIADKASQAWIIDSGKQIVYSAPDGAGGFENEGQSLRIYEVGSGKTRKVLSEYFYVHAVLEVKLDSGKSALLVRMSDSGLGGAYFAVVDPKRGEVFRRLLAELTEINGTTITLAFYREEDWSDINEARGWASDDDNVMQKPTKVAPSKTEKHDLNEVLKNKVIHLKPTNQ